MAGPATAGSYRVSSSSAEAPERSIWLDNARAVSEDRADQIDGYRADCMTSVRPTASRLLELDFCDPSGIDGAAGARRADGHDLVSSPAP